MYVVDVIVTVLTFWSPNVQKEIGAPLTWLLHGFEDAAPLSSALEPVGWYSNDAAPVTAAVEVSISARLVWLEAADTSARVSAASSENGSLVMPWIGPSESDGLPAYGW